MINLLSTLFGKPKKAQKPQAPRENKIMTEPHVSGSDFVLELKLQVRNFITYCRTLTPEQKQALIDELGTNGYDDRFNCDDLVNDAVNKMYNRWALENLEAAHLWKEVALKNAGVSNFPDVVADRVVGRLKWNFNID